MTLWAISDLHVGFEANRRALEALPDFGDDWLLLGGDTDRATGVVEDGRCFHVRTPNYMT